MSDVVDSAVLGSVANEVELQHEEWGEQDHPDGTGNLGDGLNAKAARGATEHAASKGTCTWRLILKEEVQEAFAESGDDRLREELTQVAAVAVSWIQAINRRSE